VSRESDEPSVVIIGAGFAGFSCARRLGDRGLRVPLVTEDTVQLGFGIEQLDGPAAQAQVLGDALRLIGVRTR
jgi:ribulose 1,5-bisphosphate synthetase/thiazole synthase